jgi:hypothetical protein
MNNNLPSLHEQKVQAIEKEFLKQEQVDCPVVHRFAPNIYIREVTIPAGTFSIGHYQKTTHLNIMLAGKVIMVNQDGSKTEVVAPCTFVSKPGRKIGYIVEKMIWQNVYATDETDVEKLEAMFLEKSITWQEHQQAQKLLLTMSHSEDQADFYAAIAEYGFDPETVRKQSENLDDQIKMPYGNYKFMVSESKIEGKGVFATAEIKQGEVIGKARISGKRTPLGRYTNHAKNPNGIMVLRDNMDIDLVANKDIFGCKGGDLGEEITIDYRQAISLAIRRN